MSVQTTIPVGEQVSEFALIHHGYGGSSGSPAVVRIAKAFNAAGIHTIVPDTTHSLNGMDGDIQDFTFAGHTADLGDILKWSSESGISATNAAVHLAGYSLGGYSAANSGFLVGERLRSLLLVAPIFSGAFFRQGIGKESMAYWKREDVVGFTNDKGIAFDAPYRCWKEWDVAGTSSDVSKITAPTTIITAEHDTLLRPEHIAWARRAFSNAALRVETLKGQDHFFGTPQTADEALESAVARHIKTGCMAPGLKK